MAMAQGSFFLLLIFFSSFISTNNTLYASASNQAQHRSLGLSSTPSNRISIHCQPRRMGITKCNHNGLVSAFDGGGTPLGGIIGGRHPVPSAP